MMRMLRLARRAVTILCVAAGMLLTVLWMRSARWIDTLYYVPPTGAGITRADTSPKRIYFSATYIGRRFAEPSFSVGCQPADHEWQLESTADGVFGLFVEVSAQRISVYVPYSMLFGTLGVIASLLNVQRLRQFSLRSALAAMFFVALAFGLGAVATHFGEFHWRIW
jgi:hypothetical protein